VSGGGARTVRGRRGRCPVCGRPRDPRFRPFCSRLCRDRDFLAWMDERHRLPVVEEGEEPSRERGGEASRE